MIELTSLHSDFTSNRRAFVILRVTDGRILTYYSFSVSKYVCVFSLFSRVIFSCSDLVYIFWHYVLYRVVWSPSYALLVSRLVCGIFSNYYHKSFEFPLKWYFFLVGTCKTPTKNQGHSGISKILSVSTRNCIFMVVGYFIVIIRPKVVLRGEIFHLLLYL